jgi:hypothetical protein
MMSIPEGENVTTPSFKEIPRFRVIQH